MRARALCNAPKPPPPHLPHAPCQTNCRDPVFRRLFPELVELHRKQVAEREAAAAAAATGAGGGGGEGAAAGASSGVAAAGAAAGTVGVGAPGSTAAVAQEGGVVGGKAQEKGSSPWLILAFVLVLVAALWRQWKTGSPHGV